MISGIKLPVTPNIDGVTLNNVLADLDLLNEKYPKTTFKNARGVGIEKKIYIGNKYTISLIEYEKEDNSSFDSLCKLYSLISSAIPKFIKSFRCSNRLIMIAYPKFDDYRVNELYEFIMEEVQRVSVFLIKTFGMEREDYIKELIRDYVDMCVEYPGK